MKLIVENDFRDFDLLIEQKNPNEPKFIRVRGPYIVAEEKNANGRVYKQKLMEAAVNKYINDYVKTHRSFGELNHPASAVVNYERACHLVTALTQEKNVWIGESTILSSNPQFNLKGTPMGDIIASVLQHGGKPGMSTRGVGEINESGTVDKDFILLACDAVSDPSGPNCYVNGILESKEFMINVHGDIIEAEYKKFENGLADIPTNSTKTSEGDAHIKSLIENFLKSI